MAKQKQDTFIPLDEDDVKHALEVPVKHVDKSKLEKIEKLGGKPMIRKDNRVKIERVKSENRKKDYILIITEKPAAALKIASALGKAVKREYLGVAYYELEREGKKIVVACAVGHLFSVSQRERGGGYPNFDVEWKANYLAKKADWSKKYYLALSYLCKNAESFILACDYDIEGEVIGWNIIRFIAKQKDASRMKFSSLTKDELERAYDSRSKTIDWGQAIAGETRHFLDWFYGINLSRALMSAIKKAGNFRIMSIGRVQGPTLYLVVEKERKIKSFKPTPYWQVFVLIGKTWLKFIKDITKKEELDRFKLEGKEGEANTIKRQEKISPLAPFDLTTLQTEAYKFFKINPARTLQITQQLYLVGLISYPRTSSQKLPEAIGYKKILGKLDKNLTKFVRREKPVEGSKSDSAHPSIYPTGEKANLRDEEKKIYELIIKRFVNCFCEDALIENKKIEFIVENLKFEARGLEIIEKGWLNVYPAILIEKELKDLNGRYKVEKVKIEEKETMPPRRYSPASIVAELTKRNLGTKATRANIIETLYSRNYIKGQNSIEATALGMSLIESLEKHSPIIIDEKLTREFEREMESIQTSKMKIFDGAQKSEISDTAKKDLEVKEKKVLEKAKKVITEISDKFKKEEEEIGKELVIANNNMREQEKEASKIIVCPGCKKGSLVIRYSPKFKKSFIACDKYPECRVTYSLPSGFIKKADKVCEKCGFPLLIRISKGKRPWVFCFNEKNHKD